MTAPAVGYRLVDHVFVCRCNGTYIALDLRRDKYIELEVEPQESAALASAVAGWPSSDKERPANADTPTTGAMFAPVQMLLEHGLIVADSEPLTRAPILPVRSDLRRYVCVDPPSGRHILNFFLSWIGASFRLRFRSLESITRRVAIRRRRYATTASTHTNSSLDPLINTFNYLRPWFFRSKDACLRETFVLIEFLARYSIYPRWVFGVRMHPLAAHCWAETSSTVLNDSVDNVRAFTPIMAVE